MFYTTVIVYEYRATGYGFCKFNKHENLVIVIVYVFQTRMQSLTCEKQHRMGIFKMLTTMMREEGVFRYFAKGQHVSWSKTIESKN